jgi:hypothetical protein
VTFRITAQVIVGSQLRSGNWGHSLFPAKPTVATVWKLVVGIAEAPYEEQVKNILKRALKRRAITYVHLTERLKERGAKESERNLANWISQGSFTAAFFMMCMDAIGVRQGSLET